MTFTANSVTSCVNQSTVQQGKWQNFLFDRTVVKHLDNQTCPVIVEISITEGRKAATQASNNAGPTVLGIEVFEVQTLRRGLNLGRAKETCNRCFIQGPSAQNPANRKVVVHLEILSQLFLTYETMFATLDKYLIYTVLNRDKTAIFKTWTFLLSLALDMDRDGNYFMA